MTTIKKYMYGSIRSLADFDCGPDSIMRLLYEITGISYKHEGEIVFDNIFLSLCQASNLVISLPCIVMVSVIKRGKMSSPFLYYY